MSRINRYHPLFVFLPLLSLSFQLLQGSVLLSLILPNPPPGETSLIRFPLRAINEYFNVLNSVLLILFFIFVVCGGVEKAFPIDSFRDVIIHSGLIYFFVIIGISIFHSLLFYLLFSQNVEKIILHLTETQDFTIYDPFGLDVGSGFEFTPLRRIIILDSFLAVHIFFITAFILILMQTKYVPNAKISLYPKEESDNSKISVAAIDNSDEVIDPISNTNSHVNNQSMLSQHPYLVLSIISILWINIAYWTEYAIDHNINRSNQRSDLILDIVNIGITFVFYLLAIGLSFLAYHFIINEDNQLSGILEELKEIGKSLVVVVVTLSIIPFIFFLLSVFSTDLSSLTFFQVFAGTIWGIGDTLPTKTVFLLTNVMWTVFVGLPIFLSFNLVRLAKRYDNTPFETDI